MPQRAQRLVQFFGFSFVSFVLVVFFIAKA